MVRRPVHIRFGLILLKPPRRPLPLSKWGKATGRRPTVGRSALGTLCSAKNGTLIGSGVISLNLSLRDDTDEFVPDIS